VAAGGPRSAPAPSLGGQLRLTPADAAIWETFVVPRYLSLFGELALEHVVEIDQAQVVHVGCRTGYPDRGLAMKLPNSAIVGVDASPPALALARAKSITMSGMIAEYREGQGFPTPLPEQAFSHAIALLPPPVASPKPGEGADDAGRHGLFTELHRLLAPSGQVLVALPMRGSFVEIADLLREFGLKFEDPALIVAVDRAAAQRPTAESLCAEVEAAGFGYAEVVVRTAKLAFSSGRELLEDPLMRLALVPEFKSGTGLTEVDRPLGYLREAIDKYWSDGTFELTVEVGCVSARRLVAG
jgi:SAM-dependent methyltransferase